MHIVGHPCVASVWVETRLFRKEHGVRREGPKSESNESQELQLLHSILAKTLRSNGELQLLKAEERRRR